MWEERQEEEIAVHRGRNMTPSFLTSKNKRCHGVWKAKRAEALPRAVGEEMVGWGGALSSLGEPSPSLTGVGWKLNKRKETNMRDQKTDEEIEHQETQK